MSQTQDEFEYRIRVAVARFFDHARRSGMDVNELDGEVTLTLEAGELTEIKLPAKARRRKSSDEASE